MSHLDNGEVLMPKLSEFFGIIISMYFYDTGKHKAPHFHAMYAGEAATYSIDTLTKLAGGLSPRAERLVLEWATLHQAELREQWNRSQRGETLSKIPPLE